MKNRIALALAALVATLPLGLFASSQPAKASASIRAVLSTAGQSAYDTATSGSYFAVSAADFDSAANNLSSVTKIGMADAERTNGCTNFSANYATVINNTITIPPNAYILGYATRIPGVPTDAYTRLITSTTYKGSYSFLVAANFPKSVGGMNYYLFKTPVTSASTRYLGLWANVNTCLGAYSSTTGGYGAGATEPFTISSNYSNNFPFLQVLYTTDDQWNSLSTISISTSGGVSVVSKGSNISLNAVLSDDGLVTFKDNGKNIGKCVSVQSSSLNATCNWKPTVQGSRRITATLRSPTASFISSTSPTLQLSVVKRSNKR
jgi:FlaG/FlaF family flagellin (archaellin)